MLWYPKSPAVFMTAHMIWPNNGFPIQNTAARTPWKVELKPRSNGPSRILDTRGEETKFVAPHGLSQRIPQYIIREWSIYPRNMSAKRKDPTSESRVAWTVTMIYF